MDTVRHCMNATLEYWLEDGWYVGKVRGMPGVFSQGKTLEELEENIKEVFELMNEDECIPENAQHKTISLAI